MINGNGHVTRRRDEALVPLGKVSADPLPTGAQALAEQWRTDSRWDGIQRSYTAEDVCRLRGTIAIEYSLARRGSQRLWELLRHENYVRALGAATGNQALQMV